MLPNPQLYSIYPSVVPADKEVEMTIIPNERTYLLFPDIEYTIKIVAVNDDESSYYYSTKPQAQFTVNAQNGIIRFNYSFRDEQEYFIQLIKEEKPAAEFHIYALHEDLYTLTPLRGDLHSHSHRSDGRHDPAALAGHYREQGYDFFALTDHNRYFPGGEIDEVYDGVKSGFNRVLGEELHTPGSPVHIVHVGGTRSVTAEYIQDREAYEAAKPEYLKRVPADIPEKYAEKYAMAMWATEHIHAAGGLAIFAHPYWIVSSKCYNVCDELAKILLKSGMFDAYELIGGMTHMGNNRSVALWSEIRAEGYDISVVGSSDVHAITAARTFPHFFTICFAESNTNDAVKEAVKAGLTVAVESYGNEYDRQYRAYGKLRLVSYAHFLLTYYFPERIRTLAGEGVAMRAYAMEKAPASLIKAMAEMNANEADRFFGRKPPVLPSKKMQKFEDKWRKVQIEQGPITKGSAVDSTHVSRQI